MLSLKNSNAGCWIFGLFLLLSLISSLLFGFTHTPTWQDASEYSAYATNLVSGNGYSLDGKVFSNFREPGVPFFLALVYSIFGNENITAVTLVQVVLLAFVAMMFFVMLRMLNYPKWGVVLGALVVLFPSYGYYTHEVSSELLFTFFVTLSAFLLFLIVMNEKEGGATSTLYLLFGVVAGYGALVRIQFLFYVPMLAVVTLLFLRKHISWKKLLLTLFAYGVLVGGWALICYIHTGSTALTTGRPELILHGRSVRAQLSYHELGQYYVAWVHKRVTSDYIDPMLKRADLVGLTADYVAAASTTESINRIKKEDIAILKANPLHYLAGNFIEIAKLYYIEYLYTPYLGRVVRAGMYAGLYLFTLIGAYLLWRYRKNIDVETWSLVAIMSSLIFYNAAVLSFFDTIPRYNTPFLTFFLAIGLGASTYWRNRKALRER